MSTELLVWIDDWEYECCGDDFEVGTVVDWELSAQPGREYLTRVLGAELAGRVTHVQDTHGGRPDTHSGLEARVTRIRGVSAEFGPDPRYPEENAITAIGGTGVLGDVARAEEHPRTRGDLRWVGLLVDLELV